MKHRVHIPVKRRAVTGAHLDSDSRRPIACRA